MTTAYIQGALVDIQAKAMAEALRADLLVNSDNASGVQTNLDTDRGTIVTDLTAIRNAILAINAKLDTLTTKLNADGGVTDTNLSLIHI